MSYILDALKKSEQERARERAPTLASIHSGWQPPGQRRWPLWLGGGIALLLFAGGSWFYWQPEVSSVIPTPKDIVRAEAGTSAPVPVETPVTPSPAVQQPPAQESATTEPVPPPRVQELWELPDPVRADFPALTFSFHVYAEDPARRTIIINSRRMREGAVLDQDLELESITEDGVVFRFRGYRVHVPVVQGW